MKLRDWLKAAPEGVTLSWEPGALAKALEGAGEPENVTTGQAAKLLGGSRKFWERQAPHIDGAFKPNGPDGNWLLPTAACRAHLLRLKNQRKKGELRGPRRQGPGKAKAA